MTAKTLSEILAGTKPILCGLILGAVLLVMMVSLVPATPLDHRVPADVVEVKDGDTLIVDAKIWPNITVYISVRVNGLDTPELRAKCDSELVRAMAARDRAIVLAGEAVILVNPFNGKFAGRVVSDVEFLYGRDWADVMIAEGHAREYSGGHREGWCENEDHPQ